MRVEGKCIGDCSKCQLLADGEVDMIPCILDQIFARTRKSEREIAEIRNMLQQEGVKKNISIASAEEQDEEEISK